MGYTRYKQTFTLTDNTTKNILADTVTDIIMDEYESVLANRCVRTNFSFVTRYEQEKILEETNRLLKHGNNFRYPDFNARRAIVRNKVWEFLGENECIIPSGFINFRLKEYYDYIEAIVHHGADVYFEKEEYEEFTSLLSMFVTSKESREEVIHVLWENDNVKLINKRRRDVTDKYEREFYRAAKKKDINDEDLAISAVISAAPEMLVLHNPPASPLSDALMKIFDGRYKVCQGCNICKKS